MALELAIFLVTIILRAQHSLFETQLQFRIDTDQLDFTYLLRDHLSLHINWRTRELEEGSEGSRPETSPTHVLQ